MKNYLFFYYLSVTLFSNKAKNLSLSLPLFILLFLLFTILFISSSIERTNHLLSQKTTSSTTTKLYGRYFIEPKGKFFLLVGSEKINDGEMLISQSVNSWLKSHYYNSSYNFISSKNGDLVELNISEVLPKSVNLIASDVIVISKSSFNTILGVSEIQSNTQDISIPKKLFNYQGGFFISIYTVIIIGFIIILYLKYNQISRLEVRESSILRATGWSKKLLMRLKIVENFILSFSVFSFAFFTAYIYIFIFNAPLFSSIFLGTSNLNRETIFIPYVEFDKLFLILILYLSIFLLTVYLSLRGQKSLLVK